MTEYLQQEPNSDRYTTEDGSGSFLLETSTVLATVSGGGNLTVTGTATGATHVGGRLMGPGQFRKKHVRYGVPILRFGTVDVSGGGRLVASGSKHASAAGVHTGGGKINVQFVPGRTTTFAITDGGLQIASGTKQTTRNLTFSTQGNWTATSTRTSFIRVKLSATGTQRVTYRSDAVEMELRQLLEDAVVLTL